MTVQTPDDLRAIADYQAATLHTMPDPVYAAFMCMALYGAADELDRRQQAAADNTRCPRLSEIIRNKQLVKLGVEAPLRRPVMQHSDEGLGLFDVGRQGGLL